MIVKRLERFVRHSPPRADQPQAETDQPQTAWLKRLERLERPDQTRVPLVTEFNDFRLAPTRYL